MLQLELIPTIGPEFLGIVVKDGGGSNCDCEHSLVSFQLRVRWPGYDASHRLTSDPRRVRGLCSAVPRGPYLGVTTARSWLRTLERPFVVALEVVPGLRHRVDGGLGTRR